jgi:hypothetical protein
VAESANAAPQAAEFLRADEVETPKANLVEGNALITGTFGIRFNAF